MAEENLPRLKNPTPRKQRRGTSVKETKFLVLYTAQHSQSGLRAAVRQRYDAILVISGGELPFAAKRSDIFGGSEWRFLFSGRTQREAIIAGELPFAEVNAAAAA